MLVGSKEIGLEMNADETKYIVMSRDQNAGQSHNINTDNISFERLQEFECLGTTLTIKILCRKKIREIEAKGMLVLIRCRIFCLPVCYLKL